VGFSVFFPYGFASGCVFAHGCRVFFAVMCAHAADVSSYKTAFAALQNSFTPTTAPTIVINPMTTILIKLLFDSSILIRDVSTLSRRFSIPLHQSLDTFTPYSYFIAVFA